MGSRRIDLVHVAVAAGAAASVAAVAGPVGADGFDGDDTWSDNHTISLASTGDNVAVWEMVLASMYAPCSYTINGSFGASSVDPTKLFQGAHGLTADGIVGPNTWTAAKNGHLEYVTTTQGVSEWNIGWSVNPNHQHGNHYAWGGRLAKNENPTNAWKRRAWSPTTTWYGTDHPGFSGAAYQLGCD